MVFKKFLLFEIIFLSLTLIFWPNFLYIKGKIKNISLIEGRQNSYNEDVLHYIQKYRKISQNLKQPIGIAVIAYNRPHYLAKLIDSIEKNEESKTLPFYFFLDGGPNAKQKEISELIEKSKIMYKEIITQKRNFGLVKNHIDAKRFMFDWCEFNKVIILEDDLIFGPFYFKLILNLDKWASQNYDNIGIVSCWSYCFLNEAQKNKVLNWVKPSCPNWWWNMVTYCLDKKVWDNIKSILYEYEAKFIDKIPKTDEYAQARSRPSLWSNSKKIAAWAIELANNKINSSSNLKPSNKKFNANDVNSKIQRAFNKKIEKFCLGNLHEDSMMAFSLWLKDYVKIETVVNRVQHIGLDGISNFTNQLVQVDKIGYHDFNEDSNINLFIPVECNTAALPA